MEQVLCEVHVDLDPREEKGSHQSRIWDEETKDAFWDGGGAEPEQSGLSLAVFSLCTQYTPSMSSDN